MTKEGKQEVNEAIKSLYETMGEVERLSGEELRKCHNTHKTSFQETADQLMDAVGYINEAIEHLEALLVEEED